MQLALYNLFLFLYKISISIAAGFNPKALRWVRGRKGLLHNIEQSLGRHEKRIWIHCSSVGEFEQGRPLIEKLKKDRPEFKIVLTFFSPSGYELHKNYPHADYIFYLPLDGFRRSAKFIKAVNPSLAIFVKYEFWYHYFNGLSERRIPLILISAAFRKEQAFFKEYGVFFRSILKKVSYFFVQDEQSKKLLQQIGFTNVEVTGDTRYDRVYEIAQQAKKFPEIEQWKGDAPVLIAGSTWPEDERLLKQSFSALPGNWKLIIAPHEIDPQHLRQIADIFGNEMVLFSKITENLSARILVIDNIGMLASIYRYGSIAYVGGGFQKGGIHNTLEPAVFGLPVIFGPVYKKFVEANELVACGLAFPVEHELAFRTVLEKLSSDSNLLKQLHRQLELFVAGNIGATQKILSQLPLRS